MSNMSILEALEKESISKNFGVVRQMRMRKEKRIDDRKISSKQ